MTSMKPPINYDHFVDVSWFYDAAEHGNMPELGYTALKLAGETGEAVEKIYNGKIVAYDLMKELGDMLFYVTKLAHLCDSSMDNFIIAGMVDPVDATDLPTTFHDTAFKLVIGTGGISELIGKAYRDSNGEVHKSQLVGHLITLTWHIWRCAYLMNQTLDDVKRINVQKLLDRQSRGVMRGSGDNR